MLTCYCLLGFYFIVHCSLKLLFVYRMAENSKQTSEKFRCKGCDEEFANHSGRSRHHKVCEKALHMVKPYSKMEDGNFKCERCGLIATKQSNISRHVKVKHLTIKAVKTKKEYFNCNVCKKVFVTKYKLSRHEDIHKFEGYECDVCKRKYSRIDMFQRHIGKCQDGDRFAVAPEEELQLEGDLDQNLRLVYDGLIKEEDTWEDLYDNRTVEDEDVEGDDAEDGNDVVLTEETQAAVYPSDDSYTSIVIVPPNTDLEDMQSDAADFHTDLPGPSSMDMSLSEEESDARLNVSCTRWDYRKKSSNLASLLGKI